MKRLSDWRSVRLQETALERDLHARHSMWLHGVCVGTLVLGLMWAAAALQMRLGSESLALRYAMTLGAGYLAYLLVLRTWGAVLLRRRSGADGGGDLPDLGFDLSTAGRSTGCGDLARPLQVETPFVSGGGGDFGGGGASADFADASDGIGKVAEGALEVAGAADEGAVVVIPVVAVFLIGAAVLFGTGSLLLLYFGSDVLLAVAVELAFSYAAARTVSRVARAGWLAAAVRLTWKPLLGALACAVVLGATIDHFLPTAQSLPQAVRMVLGPDR